MNQIRRSSKLYGEVRGGGLFAVFWSLNASIRSYGSWYVHQTSDDRFEGYHLKFDDVESNDVEMTPPEIIRLR